MKIQEVELRPGGRLRLEVIDRDGKVWKLLSEYREVRRPDRLVFTWKWDGPAELGETLVIVEFRRLGNSNFTEVKLRHEGIPTTEEREGHNEGWIECFDLLEKALRAA